MTLKRNSIRALAELIAQTRERADAATCDLLSWKIAQYFKSQNKEFKVEPFLTKAGVNAPEEDNGDNEKAALAPPQLPEA